MSKLITNPTMSDHTLALQNVIEELTLDTLSLKSPLLKLKVLSTILKNKELEKYVTEELCGYSNPSDVPIYRQTFGEIAVDVVVQHTSVQTLILEDVMLDEPLKSLARKMSIHESVEVLEEMKVTSKEKGDESQYLVLNITVLFAPSLMKSVYTYFPNAKDTKFQSAVFRCPKKVISKILIAVRINLLELSLKLAEELGFEIDFSKITGKSEKANSIINNFFMDIKNSQGVILNTGSNSFNNANVSITQGNISQLKEELEKAGVASEDIKEIEEIATQESPEGNRTELGQKAAGWLAKVTQKGMDAGGKLAISIGANLISTYLKAFYGIGS